MSERSSIGFQTPSKQIEDAFGKMSAELDKKKTDWQAIKDNCELAIKIAKEATDAINTPPLSVNEVLLYRGIFVSQLVGLTTLSSVASIGIQLSETHKRLSRLEKAMSDFMRLPK